MLSLPFQSQSLNWHEKGSPRTLQEFGEPGQQQELFIKNLKWTQLTGPPSCPTWERRCPDPMLLFLVSEPQMAAVLQVGQWASSGPSSSRMPPSLDRLLEKCRLLTGVSA